MTNVCKVCGIEFERMKEAKTCSPKCRVTLSRKRVTHGENVTLADPIVTPDIWFEFYTKTVDRVTPMGKVPGERSSIRKAKYWYDVPLAAIPVIKKDWPERPEYMNGRQYFLWWKNEFKMNGDSPVIHNPFK